MGTGMIALIIIIILVVVALLIGVLFSSVYKQTQDFVSCLFNC